MANDVLTDYLAHLDQTLDRLRQDAEPLDTEHDSTIAWAMLIGRIDRAFDNEQREMFARELLARAAFHLPTFTLVVGSQVDTELQDLRRCAAQLIAEYGGDEAQAFAVLLAKLARYLDRPSTMSLLARAAFQLLPPG